MNCFVCHRPLKGARKKFCSDSCYRIEKADEDKRRHRRSHPYRPKINCLFCNAPFIPRGDSHKCCNAVCRQLLELKKKREIARENKAKREKSQEKQAPFWHQIPCKKKKIKNIIKPKLTPLPVINSQYQEQIETYKNNGGVVDVLPPQLNGRTPEVNLNNLYGWSVETMYGFGYELELMDELSSASEVTDAN